MAEEEKHRGGKVQGRVTESNRDKLSLEGELTSPGTVTSQPSSEKQGLTQVAKLSMKGHFCSPFRFSHESQNHQVVQGKD